MRTALVTGGSSGIGSATASRLAETGMRVVTADLAPGSDHHVDVSDPSSVAELAELVGRIDILVNCAGVVGPNLPVWDVGDDEWARTIGVNLTGTFHTCRAFIPGMVEGGWGRIVNVASMAGKDGNPRLGPYSASKAGVIALTKSMAKELATTGVLANSIAPGVIATPMNATTSDEVLEHLVGLIPMRRTGRVEEVAELIAWLCSDACSFSTGAVYDISGGRAVY